MEPEKYLISRMHKLSDLERERIEKNQGLIGDVIRTDFLNYVGKSRTGGEGPLSYNDLFAAGQFGLIEAAARWDIARGAFSTCAEMWIKNKIRRYIREYGSQIRIPKWIIHAKPEKDGVERVARERSRMNRIRAMQPVSEALDKTHAEKSKPRILRRRLLLRLAYLIPMDSDDVSIGRIVFIKMAGADGGTAGLDDDERFAEIASGIGVQKARARKAYEGFLARLQARVADLGIDDPGV